MWDLSILLKANDAAPSKTATSKGRSAHHADVTLIEPPMESRSLPGAFQVCHPTSLALSALAPDVTCYCDASSANNQEDVGIRLDTPPVFVD